MNKKERARAAELALAARYPEAVCSLEWGGDSFRLLIMAILSAQCTDARVNLVSQTLFARYGDAYALAAAPVSDIENEIHSVGLYRSKALALSECSKRICEVYGGRVPHETADLLTLRGVGRKVANLVRGDAFGLGRHSCGHALHTHLRQAFAFRRQGSARNRTLARKAYPPRKAKRFLPQAGAFRAGGVHRPRPEMRGMPAF